MEEKYKMMTQQLRITNSDEEVAAYLRWIITSDAAKEYWENALLNKVADSGSLSADNDIGMKEVTLKIQFDDEGCYKGHGDDTAELIKEGLKQYLQIDLQGDNVIKKGWTVEAVLNVTQR